MRVVYEIQQQKKCIIVLDEDIWHLNKSGHLKDAFPGGITCRKMLPMTRNREVALYIDSNVLIHELRYLTRDESRKLLQKKSIQRTKGSGEGKKTALYIPWCKEEDF